MKGSTVPASTGPASRRAARRLKSSPRRWRRIASPRASISPGCAISSWKYALGARILTDLSASRRGSRMDLYAEADLLDDRSWPRRRRPAGDLDGPGQLGDRSIPRERSRGGRRRGRHRGRGRRCRRGRRGQRWQRGRRCRRWQRGRRGQRGQRRATAAPCHHRRHRRQPRTLRHPAPVPSRVVRRRRPTRRGPRRRSPGPMRKTLAPARKNPAIRRNPAMGPPCPSAPVRIRPAVRSARRQARPTPVESGRFRSSWPLWRSQRWPSY